MPSELAALSNRMSAVQVRRGRKFESKFSDKDLEELFNLFDHEEKGTLTIGQVCCLLRTLELEISEVHV